jgi:hypothetical protein
VSMIPHKTKWRVFLRLTAATAVASTIPEAVLASRTQAGALAPLAPAAAARIVISQQLTAGGGPDAGCSHRNTVRWPAGSTG